MQHEFLDYWKPEACQQIDQGVTDRREQLGGNQKAIDASA
jgi:hypothetical protein